MSDAAAKVLVDELYKAVLDTNHSPRLRLAVSPDEYERLRFFFFQRDGRFHGRIRNVPLLVEHEAPDQFVEIVTGEIK